MTLAATDGTTINYTYYDDGSMKEVELDGTKVAKYEYDAQRMRGMITRYKSDGSTTSSTTEYAYDYQNRLTAIEHKDDGAARIAKYEYGHDGQYRWDVAGL